MNTLISTLRPRQNGRRFADDTFKRIFLNENARISFKISLKFVPKGPINNNPALGQIMAWRRSGDKPLSEPTMVSLPTHICVTRPQWVNTLSPEWNGCHFAYSPFKYDFKELLKYKVYSCVSTWWYISTDSVNGLSPKQMIHWPGSFLWTNMTDVTIWKNFRFTGLLLGYLCLI